MRSRLLLALLLVALLLPACERNPLRVTRSDCPAVAIPHHAGEVTRFNPATSRDASAIDVTAQIIQLRGNCIDAGDPITTDVTFTVAAQRRDSRGARQVTLPLFIAMVQGGNVLVSKQATSVTLTFADGQRRAEAASGGRATLARSAVALSPEIREKITRERRPEDPDALTDPLAAPEVRAAVRAASFEVLVGFQLDDAALAYNVGK